MKKILLSLMLISAFAIVKAQVCAPGAPIKRWTGTGQPGDAGNSPAPITINGNSSDWETHIVGPYNYSGANKGGFEAYPYLSPVAGGNVQQDGLKDTASGPNYDRDAVGQDHRDLRYFAFTFDQKNIYFIFRRPKNNTAQVKLYYFFDINVDGYMKTGEPVLQVSFNNSGSSIEMGYYEAVNSNAAAAGSYDAVKGNIMSAPVARAKTNNTSEWEVGSTDGWSMPGNFKGFGHTVSLPALAAGEVFSSATLTDAHPDGNVSGYGVEFAVPWQYLRLYNAQGANGSPITYMNVFTWHVSLVGGNSGVSTAEDNAGGCCSGLAVSGTPNVSSFGVFGANPLGVAPWDYRLNITYTDAAGANTKLTTSRITVRNPKDANGADIPGASLSQWVLTAFPDGDCNGDAASGSVALNYDASNSEPFDADGAGGNKDYVYNVSNPLSSIVTAPANNSACIYINLATQAGGWPPLKTAVISWSATSDFDISSNACTVNPTGNVANFANALPVKFSAFKAVRNGKNVDLTWQTASEDNNTGFEIQRFIGASGWQNIGFVSTQAANGTSSKTLTYQFTDYNNNAKGISQYRIKQIDKDNRSSFSEIRSVRADGQKGKTILYPNPSNDGKVNILFEDMDGIRDVSVMDMSGRLIKQWKAVTNNNIQIDNLNAGFYTVRVVNIETGEQVVEKFVVNKR